MLLQCGEKNLGAKRKKITPPWCRSSGCAEIVQHDFYFSRIEVRKRQQASLCVQKFMDNVDPPLVIIRGREVGHGLVDIGAGQLRLGNLDLPANTT
jgi:hypothetical protein